MINTRFSTALHILAALAVDDNVRLTSSILATQLGKHPVVIRRLVAELRDAGLVSASRGTGGGIRLVVNPEETTLGQIADLIDLDLAFKSHSVSEDLPSEDHLAASILAAIRAQRRDLHSAAVRQLSKTTLADLTNAATLRADAARLLSKGLSNDDIRSGYRIESGHLVKKDI